MAAHDAAPDPGGEQDDADGVHPALPPARPPAPSPLALARQGIPAREIGDRAGQRQIAVTLDVYTHTMPLDEVSAERFLSLLD